MSPDAGWTDRDASPGQKWRAVWSRITGDAENPMAWGFGIGTVWGVRVRVSLWFVVFAIGQVVWSISLEAVGPWFAAMEMGVLFALVLLHEFGHVFACRAVGGTADDVLLWPLGGLAACHPPHNWRADLATTLGGPMVNVLLLPATSLGLWASGAGEAILFNPFDAAPTLGSLAGWGVIALWYAHFLNIVLLGFNLLPMFPLDGGRVLHALAWARLDERRGRELAATVGLIAAIGLGVLSLPGRQTQILGVAIFCGIVCWQERQRLRTESEILFGAPASPDETRREEARLRAEQRRREREEREQAEVDRILAKIAASGMGSLTRKERRALELATKRRRGG